MAWNLRRKILAGYVIVIALAGIVLGLALVNIVRLGNASNSILQENYRSILAAEEMLEAVQDQENASLSLALDFDPQALAQFSAAEQRFLTWLARAKDNITIDGEAEILDRIERDYSEYLYELARFRQSQLDDRARAFAFFREELAPKSALVRAACEELHELNRQTMEASSSRAQRVAQMAVWSMAIVGAIALGAGIAFSVWMADLIVRPLARLAEITEKVAAGDYDVSIRPESRDEIGQLAEKFNVMITKLRAYHELNLRQIVGEQNKAEAILKTIDDGVLVVNADGKVASLNPAARKALGVGPQRVVGAQLTEVVRHERLCSLIDETLDSGKPPRLDEQRDFITVAQDDESRLHYEYLLTPIFGRDASVLGAVVLLRNVTRLKELDRLKTEFVMTASHELRTPLTSISMSIGLLREKMENQADESTRQLLDVAHEETERLRGLVDELLNLSKIESGKIDMEFAGVSLADVVRTAVAPFRSQADEQGLELSVETDESIPPVKADGAKLAWVVTNLVGNALRYARTHIWISVERAGQWSNIYVRDDGPGIPHEQQARIFDKFVQVGDREHSGGAGLGLALARGIVRAHGGHIWVESEPGHGSLFIVTLPADSSGTKP